MVREDQGTDCSIRYTYDPNGNRTSRTTTLENAAESWTRTVNYTYDRVNQATTVEIAGHHPIRFDRNQLGQVIRESLGVHLKRWSEYDTAGYLTRQGVASETGPLFQQEYAYDRTGNLTRKSDSVYGTVQYHYDPIGRITRQVDPLGQVQNYLYDTAGDRLTTQINSGSPEDPEQPWSRTGQVSGATYEFDRAGNLVKRTGAQETTEFFWDANGRLVRSTSSGHVTQYRYDPLGRRIAKKTAGITTRFFWDGDALLGDLRSETKGGSDPVCTRSREWVYYPGSFEPLAMVQTDGLTEEADPGRVYYYSNDPNGCPTRLLDEDGKVVWATQYDAWGKVKKLPVEEVDQPLRLQGQYFDEETGLYYNRFRYYEPQIGGFISKDPLSLLAGENIYAFGPNIFRWIDPLGLCKGKANIRQYTADPIEHPNEHHFVVEVKHGKNSCVTEQYGAPGTDTGIIFGDSMAQEGFPTTGTYSFDLPNAKAAMDYQKQLVQETNFRNMRGIPGAPYDLETKSCLTHCFDVIRTGGVENVPKTSEVTRDLVKFMGKHRIK